MPNKRIKTKNNRLGSKKILLIILLLIIVAIIFLVALSSNGTGTKIIPINQILPGSIVSANNILPTNT